MRLNDYNEKGAHRYDIGLSLDMDINILNIRKCLSLIMFTSIKHHLSNI